MMSSRQKQVCVAEAGVLERFWEEELTFKVDILKILHRLRVPFPNMSKQVCQYIATLF